MILINAQKHIKVKLWHLIIIAALSVVARVILLGDYIGHDDAYIYLRYAKNISAGHGWSFNPGEPSYGTTSPLWTLILVFGNVLGFGADNFGVLISLLALFFIPIIGYYLISLFTEEDIKSFAYACSLATLPWIIRWSGTVMETTLATFLAMLFVYLAYKYKKRPILSLIGGLMFLVRPELVIVWLFSIISKNLKNVILNVCYFLLPVIPWLIFAYITFGQITPNTLIKASAPILHIGVKPLMQIGATFSVFLPVFVYILFVNYKDFLLSIRKYWRISLVVITLILYYVWRTNGLQSPARYMNFSYPLAAMFIFLPIKRVKQLLSALVILIICYALISGFFIVPKIDMFQNGYKNAHILAAKWLSGHSAQDDKVFVLLDIGIIGYYCDRYIIDWGGLATPYIPKNFKNVEDAVISTKPKFFVHTQRSSSWAALRQYKRLNLIPIIEFFMPPTGVGVFEPKYTSIYKVEY